MLLRTLRCAAWNLLLLLFSFAFSSFSLFVDEGMERKKKASKFIKAIEKGVEAFCGDF